MVADDNHHRHVRPARVVQVGQAVAQPGAQVQQHRRRPVGDAGVTIGRAGGDTFEEGEHTAHPRNGVQCGNEVHLRGARVGEAHVNAAVDQGIDQGLSTIHESTSLVSEPEDTLGVAVQTVEACLLVEP